jgi:ABC-type polysaccharide/polyol phosphate transport system ATPase subunit
MALIELNNVGLTFRVRTNGRFTLKEYLIKGKFRRRRTAIMEVSALKDISFRLADGARVGIIGHNGAGKSTLLRVLAGVYAPTAGCRVVAGKIASLFEITLGFELEASGWENIAFRSFFQGETPRTLRGKMAGIAEFSELGEFLNMPLRYYSSGMLIRLAFSIATAIEPEILIIDEVLGAGDESFQAKARARIEQLMQDARIVVLVSHDMRAISQLCEQVVWLERGRVRERGPAERVIAAYHEQNQRALQQAA